MKQIILGRDYGFYSSSGPRFAPLRGGGVVFASNADNIHHAFWLSHPWSVDGTFRDLYVEILAPVENKESLYWEDTTFELYIDGAGTGLTVTVPAAGPIAQNGFSSFASNSVDMAPITAGAQSVQLVNVDVGTTIHGVINGAHAHIAWSITFESTNPKESGYGSGSYTAQLGNSNRYMAAPLSGSMPAFDLEGAGPTAVLRYSLMPLAGDLFRIDVVLDVAPGMGQARTFLAGVNDVEQDGTGGTIDTTFTISDTAVHGFSTFTLPLVVLDRLTIYERIPSGSPAFASANVSVGFRATVDGQSALCFNQAGTQSRSDTAPDWTASLGSGYAWTTACSPTPPPSWRPDRWPSTELLMSLPGGITTYTLSGLCVALGAAPGTSKTRDFTTRVALGAPPGTPVLSMSDADQTAIGSGGLATFSSPTSRLDLQIVDTGTPAAAEMSWVWLMVSPAGTAPPGPGTAQVLRRVRRFPFPAQGNKMMFLSRVEFLIQAGEGLTPGAASDPPVLGSDPIIMFRLSRDGGQTWGQELQMGIGRQGAYTFRAFRNMLGRGRNLVGEVSCTDPIPLAFLDCVADLEIGTS